MHLLLSWAASIQQKTVTGMPNLATKVLNTNPESANSILWHTLWGTGFVAFEAILWHNLFITSEEAWHNFLLLLGVAPPLMFTMTSFQAMAINSLTVPSPSLGV